jgi:hypothetical protein
VAAALFVTGATALVKVDAKASNPEHVAEPEAG